MGSGAFGRVYLVYDRDARHELAMKRVALGVHMDSDTRKKLAALECEIQILKNIKHKCVVQYFGCVQEKGSICIFMEFMSGGSVKDLLLSRGPLSAAVAASYTRQVLEGLVHIHHHGIIHRDIKSANILRNATSGSVKLADFGAAKLITHVSISSGNSAGFAGTPYWMSPDAILNECPGRKADIWSLGATVVEFLTTRPPNSCLEPMAALFRVATTNQMDFELPSGASSAADFVRLCFQRDREKRPSAIQLLSHEFARETDP